MTSIRNLIKKEHEKIMKELEDAIKFFNKNQEHSQKSFEKFEWLLKKHIFMEEKVIFSSPYLNENIISGFEGLLQEHKEILDRVREINEGFEKESIEDLKEFLKAHERTEDFGFYPKLDDELSEEERRKLIERIREKI